jgi:hypothetical protein
MVVQTIIRSCSGRWLRTPVTVDIPDPVDEVEKGLQEYIISSCTVRMPRLVSLVFENASVMALCRHLKNHRIASQSCLYNYLWSIYNFSNWLKITPDELVNDCKDRDGYAKPKAIVQVKQRLDSYVAYLRNKNLSHNTINNHIRGVDCLFRSNDVQLNLHFRLPKWVAEDYLKTDAELQRPFEDFREKNEEVSQAKKRFTDNLMDKLTLKFEKAPVIEPIKRNKDQSFVGSNIQSLICSHMLYGPQTDPKPDGEKIFWGDSLVAVGSHLLEGIKEFIKHEIEDESNIETIKQIEKKEDDAHRAQLKFQPEIRKLIIRIKSQNI